MVKMPPAQNAGEGPRRLFASPEKIDGYGMAFMRRCRIITTVARSYAAVKSSQISLPSLRISRARLVLCTAV